MKQQTNTMILNDLIPFCTSLALHSVPAAAAPLPRIFRAPSLRALLNRSRAFANASFTNERLPISAPSTCKVTVPLTGTFNLCDDR